MRSFLLAALCLSLFHVSYAAVPHSYRDLQQRDAEPEPDTKFFNAFKRWLDRLFPASLEARQGPAVCYEDEYYDFAHGIPQGQEFCQLFMNYTNVTITMEHTPTSLVYQTISTQVHTDTELTRVTPTSTVTVTITAASSPVKRDAEAQITARAQSREEKIEEVIREFRREAAEGGSSSSAPTDSSAVSSALSSACACQDYTGPTNAVTYTAAVEVVTEDAFINSHTTVIHTRTEAAIIVTETVTVAVSMDSASSTPPIVGTGASATSTMTSSTSVSITSASSAPTGTAFSCPGANGTIVSQMVGAEAFDYMILCDTILGDSDFYAALNYATFGECVAACSLGDDQFDFPVCQGVSYYDDVSSSSGGNCHLKSSANQTFTSDGVDSAVLQLVKVGISNTAPSGTSTESVPFSGPTSIMDPQQVSSSMSAIMSDSSTSLSTMTPVPVMKSGLLANNQAPITAYSTYVSAGRTYSTGTEYYFSTMYPNGSWTAYYFSTWSESWASATEIYGASATGISLANSTTSESTQQANGSGGYTIITNTSTTEYTPYGYNVTEVISSEFYHANGTEYSSTATTHQYSYQTATGGSAGGVGGGAGGTVSSSAGSPASGSAGLVTSTSVYSTQTVIVNSYATSGSTAYVTGGGPPSSTVKVVVNTFGTSGGSTFGASGGIYSTSTHIVGSGSGVGIGAPTPTQYSLLTVTVNSGATNGGTTFGAAGGGGSTAVSGGPNVTFSQGNGLRTGGYRSGSSSPTGPFSNSEQPRSGFESSTPSSPPVFPTSNGYYHPPPSYPVGPASTGGSSSTIPTTSAPSHMVHHGSLQPHSTASVSGPPFSNSGAPRYGNGSTGAPSGTAPISSPSGTFVNSNGNRSGYPFPSGTAPTSSSSGPFSNSNGNRSGYPFPSGTAPTSSPSGMFSNSNGNRSGYPFGNSSTSTPTAASGTTPHHHPKSSPSYPFNQSNGNRSGYPYSIPTQTHAPSSCKPITMYTTTVTATTTICDSTCANGGYYYGPEGPATFGPPVLATTATTG